MTNEKEAMEGLLARAVKICSEPIDDRESRPDHLPSLRTIAEELEVTTIKARKLLITADYFSSIMSREIKQLSDSGLSPKQIGERLGLGPAAVYGYLPYKTVAYSLDEISANASRHKRYRDRAEAVKELLDRIPAPKRLIQNGPIRQTPDVQMDIGWTGPVISRMVRSERYCGDVLLQKSFVPDYLTHEPKKNKGEKPQYYVQDHHEAIISREQFKRVQTLLECGRRSKKYTRTDKAFTHRLYCPHCGRYYHNRNTSANAHTKIAGPCLNFGVCKGETFDRALIYPNGPLTNFVLKGNALDHPEKYYVGVTRPRYSIAFAMKRLPARLSGYEEVVIPVAGNEIRALKYQSIPFPAIR